MKKCLLNCLLGITIIFCVNKTTAQQKTNFVDPVTHKPSTKTNHQVLSKSPKKTSGTFRKTQTNTSGKSSSAVINVTISSSNQLCGNIPDGTATASASGGTPPYQYYWDGGNATGKTTPSVTGLYAGEYTVVVIDSLCDYDTAVVNIGIINSVYLGLGSSTSGEHCGKCDGEITIFPSGSLAGGYRYSWSPGGETTANLSNLCAGYYILTLIDSATGCAAIFDSTNYGHGLIIESLAANLGISYYQACDDSIYFFSEYFYPDFLGAVDTACYNPHTWEWFFSDGFTIDSIENPVRYFSTPGVYTATLIVNSTDIANASISFSVNATTDFQYDTDCFSNTANFNDISNYCTDSWLWDFGDPASGILNSDTLQYTSHIYTTAGTYTVSLTVNASQTITKVITIAKPHADFTTGNDCSLNPTVFDFYDNSTCATSWSWNFGDPSSGLLNTDTLQSPNHLYNSTGTFTVTLIVGSNGMFDTIPKTISTPQNLVINLGNDTLILAGNSVTLDAGPGGSEYSWSNGRTTRMINVSQPGFYEVTVMDSSGCFYYSERKLVAVCGVNPSSTPENNNELQAVLFPNPFSGKTNLQLSNYSGTCVLSIFDLLGKEIRTYSIKNSNEIIYTEGFLPGMYFYRIVDEDNKSKAGKVIIE